MSAYLAKPLCTEAQARADLARRLYLAILREMAADYRHKARGAGSSEKHANAGDYRDRPHACTCAVRRLLAPLAGPRPALDPPGGRG